MSYGRAHKAVPNKKVSSGISSGGTAGGAAGGASIDTSGITASLDTINASLDTINTTLRAANTESDSYIPDSLIRSLTVLSGQILYIDKPERYNDLTNSGQIIITPTGILVIFGILGNSGTIVIHNGGRLVT